MNYDEKECVRRLAAVVDRMKKRQLRVLELQAEFRNDKALATLLLDRIEALRGEQTLTK